MFILSNVLSLVATLGLTASLTQSNVNALSPRDGRSCSLFRCCVSPLPTAFGALWQSIPCCLAGKLPASLLRHSLPTGFSRIGMCSSVHYGLIVDIHEVITCCRFSLHSILLLNIALISGKEHQHTCVFTIFHTTILHSVLMHVLLPRQYL